MDIDESNLGRALDLLEKGMPERTRGFWQAGIERALAQGDNRALGLPIGRFMMDRERPVGVIFMLASRRDGSDLGSDLGSDRGPDRGSDRTAGAVVNLSTWYVEPEFRWRAALLLKSAIRDPAHAYTSLTPIPSVQKMLTVLGFVPCNDGLALTCVPVAALKPSAGRAVDALSLPPGTLSDRQQERMRRAAALGCVAIAHPQDGRHHGATPHGGRPPDNGWQTLALKPRRLKGVPAWRVVYADDLASVRVRLGSICRYLLAFGRPLLIVDRPADGRQATAPGIALRHHGRAFAKDLAAGAGLDHLGSELVYFDF